MGFSNRQITKGSVPIGEIRRSLVPDPWARTLSVQSVHPRAAGAGPRGPTAGVVSAANVKFNNIRFGCGLDLLTTIVIVAGGAGGVVFEDCFLETSGAVQPVSGIVIEDVNCRISRLRVPNGTGFESAGCTQAILISTTGGG